MTYNSKLKHDTENACDCSPMILQCVHNNNIAVFVVQYNYVVGPMARPGARGLGPGLGLKYDNCVAGRAGPGHTLCGPGRARAS